MKSAMVQCGKGTNGALLLVMFPTIGILMLNGLWNGPLFRHSPALFWLVDLFSHLVIPLTLLLWISSKHKISPREYGLGAPNILGWGDFLALLILTCALYWLSYRVVSQFFGNVLMSEPGTFDYAAALPESYLARLAVGIYFSASAALFEEIMYRGLPLIYLRSYLSRPWLVPIYALTSGVLFGMAHWENGAHELIATFSLGVVACLIYSKVLNLWPLVIAHFWINILAYV